MIYTVTFNPSLDYIVTVPDFTLGVVNRTTEEIIFPGGKGINVSMVLKNLGFDSRALGFMAGFTGKEIARLLSERGIPSDFIHVKEGISRINVKIRGREESEINGQGPAIQKEDIDRLYRQLDDLKDGDALVLAGSIPDVMPGTMYMDIMEYVQDKKLLVAVDATRDLLVNVLKYHPFLISPTTMNWKKSSAWRSRPRRMWRPTRRNFRNRAPGTCWFPWRETERCLSRRMAASLRPCRQRARSSIPWAPGIPWWQVFWPAIWRRAITREPFTWASAPEALRLFPRDWRRRRTCTRCSRR